MNDRFIQALSDLLVGKTVTILSLTGTGQVRSSETTLLERVRKNGDTLSLDTDCGVFSSLTHAIVRPEDHLVVFETDADIVKRRVLLCPDVSFAGWCLLSETLW